MGGRGLYCRHESNAQGMQASSMGTNECEDLGLVRGGVHGQMEESYWYQIGHHFAIHGTGGKKFMLGEGRRKRKSLKVLLLSPSPFWTSAMMTQHNTHGKTCHSCLLVV